MADRRRRRRRASQDSEDEDESGSGSGSDSGGSASPSSKNRAREPELPEATAERSAPRSGPKSDEESECESEDGVGEAVLSDYDSADPEENGSHSEGGEEEEAFTEETTTTSTAVEQEVTKAPPSEDTPPRDEEENGPKEESKTEDKSNVTGERQSGDGQESTDDPETKSGGKQKLDDDEDRKNPAYIPRKGLFFEHDLRGATQEEERPKGRNRKLWKDEGRWEHDRFREEEQAPKSREELIAIYGYDIRNNNRSNNNRSNAGGGNERRRERRSRPSVSPSREQRWREERPVRSWQGGAPRAPPPQTANQSAPSAPRARAPPPRSRGPNVPPPYRSEGPGVRGPHTRGERHSPKVALEFTAGGGGVATARGGRGFRGAPSDDITVDVNEADQILSEGAVYHQTQEQKPLPLSSDPIPQTTSSPASANRDGSPSTERPVERKSYSLVRRTRSRPADMGSKQTSVEDTPPAPSPKSWATGDAPSGGTGAGPAGSLSDMDQDLARLSLGQNWSQNPTSYIRSEIRGLTNPLHVPSGQFQPLDEMSSNRAKRYSAHRQRSVPDPAPPMHLGVMEGHYYEPMSYQGPMYTHGDGPAPLAPQGMLVQPEMHMPHPGLHPHQSGGPITNPALYGAPPVSLSPGQPQQLLPPPFYPPPGVMTFPYPAMYPTPQAQSQVTYGGVTYYDTMQQQAQPKPSPPRRTSQPVTVKAPPPELSVNANAPPPELPYASE
ncbi:protein CASC3 [Periophthalmus magnuspinnatus]|uniref:protein CASC3 n=1 Tax=Periophthalmus magnuspinnatus TaxID=409849 RepID=UPI00145B2C1C|nr:protein CASC3 [Periophthalmus magnuspinnatus]